MRDESLVPAYYYPFNTFIIIFYPIYIVTTIIWFIYERRNSLFLRKRSLFSVCVSAVGGFAIIIMGPVRNMNSRAFPCDLLILCQTMCVPLVLTPVVLRLYMFRNSLEWNKHLAKTSMNRLNHATGYEDKPNSTTSPPQHKSRKSVYHGIASVRVANSGDSGSVEDSNASGTQMQKLTLGLWFRSSSAFVIMLALIMYIMYFLILSLPILLIKPWYLHGCTGCLYHADEQGAAYVGASMVGNLLLAFAYNIRNEKDPLEIKSEVAWAQIPGSIVGGVGALGILIDVIVNQNNGGTVEDHGYVQWEWFLVGTIAVIHFYQCPLQVIKSKRVGRVKGLPSTQEFITLLDNPSFLKLFEAHCVSEFSVENLKFYKSVEAEFKAKYHVMKGKDRDNVAMAIYNAYISNGAVMEINIKHHVRSPLEAIFDNSNKEQPSDIPIDVFDAAQEEITDLMRRDILARWVGTKEYHEWATKSLMVKDGVVTVLS
jgi:hypothetical protein